MTTALINLLSERTGASPDGIRLFTGLILSQLFSIAQYFLLSKISNVFVKRLVHISMGMIVGFLVWGVACLHHLVSALGLVVIINLMDVDIAGKVNFLYQMGYLVIGYYYNNMTSDYAINWTTSQSILTLKMIGLGFDIKGRKDLDSPGTLNIIGYTFFVGNYLVGPLDDFNRFEMFMEDNLYPKNKHPGLGMGLKRLSHGIFYLILSLISSHFLSSEFLFKDDFANMHFTLRLLYVTVLGHCGLYKYLGVWCIAESACMYMGYTYNGDGKWDGLRNVATMSFHRATRLQHIIDTWNINTSNWCAKHVFKKCKFLGNKYLSMIITMVFLALWHGIHIGYLVCFLQEFFYIFMEKGFSQNSALIVIGQTLPKPVGKFIAWVYAKVFLSFALVGFELYEMGPIHRVYSSIYYVCPIVAVFLILSNAVFAVKRTKKVE